MIAPLPALEHAPALAFDTLFDRLLIHPFPMHSFWGFPDESSGDLGLLAVAEALDATIR